MSRIVPQNTNPKQKLPNWMNKDELLKVSKTETQHMEKTASKSDMVPIKYSCKGCGKIVLADHPDLKNQKRVAALKNVEADLKCPYCEASLVPEVAVPASVDKESRATDSYELKKESNYNTYADRLVVIKMMDALQKFASKIGMTHADVKYIKAEHTKQAGQQNDILNTIECQIDWEYGRKQHARVYASVSLDPAGKIQLPRTFKTSSNQEFPFDKDTVASLMREADFQKQIERQPKKTDIPVYKKPDPSNFHMASEKQADAPEDGVNFPEPSTQDNTELMYQIRSLYGDPNNTTGLIMPENISLSDSQAEVVKEVVDRYNSSVDGDSNSVNSMVQQINEVINSGKIAWDNPNSMSYNPMQPVSPQSTGVIQKHLNPQETVYNTQDNTQYVVKQQTPQATTLVNPNTNQESVVPAGQENYLKPVTKTTSDSDIFEEALKEQVCKSSVKEGDKNKNNSEKERVKNMSMRWNTIRKSFNDSMQACSWKGSVTNKLDHFSNIPRVASIKDAQQNETDDAEFIKYALLKGHDDITVVFDDGSQKKAHQLGGSVMMVDQTPIIIRASLSYNNEYSGEASKTPRQVTALQDIGYSPDKGDVDETGHSDHGVPMEEKKKVEVGLTEFPAGKSRDQGGYSKPSFRKMDENQVKNRENFPDRDMLPYGKQPARDIEYKGPKTDTPLDPAEASLREAVGFNVSINRPEGEEGSPKVVEKSPGEVTVTAPEKDPIKKPVDYKSIKKAPPIEEYKEPATIPVAGGKVSEAITKLQKVISDKKEVEEKMKAALKPVLETMANIKKPYESELAKQADLMRSYIDMVFDQLSQSEIHVQAYEKMLWAAVSREKAEAPQASLAQVLAEADKLDKKLSEQIRKLKAIIENSNMQMVIEQFLYEFPISGTQEKKIQSADNGILEGIIKQFEQWLRDMMPINTESLETLLSAEV